MKLSEQRQA